MGRRTEKQIDDIKYYVNRKELDLGIAKYCHTREQVDIVLYIWNEFKENWWAYDYFKDADKKPQYRDSYDEYAKAKGKLKWLEKYYKEIDSREVHLVRKLIKNLEQPLARKEQLIRNLAEMAEKKMEGKKFSTTQKKEIIALLKQNFKASEDIPFKVYNPLK